MRRQPLGTIGGVIVILYILMAIFADIVAPFDPIDPQYEDFSKYEVQFMRPGCRSCSAPTNSGATS